MTIGGHAIAGELVAQGVERVFCVPGESYLAVLDGLRDTPVEVITCRHESGAGMAAEATAKLTGRPGVVMVTRGPGATNVTAAVHIAEQDETPLVVMVGLPPMTSEGRGAFQEIDIDRLFGGMAKWVVTIRDARRIPELVGRAFRVAATGRPGPVVVGLPEDMLMQPAGITPPPAPEPAGTSCPPAAIAALRARLEAAERPMLILGGSGWSQAAVDAVAALATALDVPVAVEARRQSLFDALHPNYAGDLAPRANPALLQAVRESDLLVLLGGRMAEVPSQGYSLLDIPCPRQEIVHLHPDPAEPGRVYRPALAIQASPAALARSAALLEGLNARPRSARVMAIHQAYLDWSEAAPAMPGDLQMGAVMAHIRKSLPPEAVICNGAGNYTGWVQRFHRFRRYGTQLAPFSGTMGYGLPAAIASALHSPGVPAVAFAGDGCFMMTVQELATAVQYALPVVVVVVDNGMYGSIRMFQEREFPGRDIATALRNPDFAALARSCGAWGATVRSTDGFAPAFDQALSCGGPAVIHCIIDGEAINATTTLTQLREAALARARP